ncbi:MAG: retron system putative HNH endonuclease [Cyanobacteria bacterium P01_A01_bin.84]
MKYIRKKKQPSSLADWNRKLGNKVPNWKSFARGVKNELYQALLAEQGYICGYCGIPISRKKCHIEHFRPKSKYRHLTFEYTNLIASCQGEDEKKPTRPVHCGHKKGAWFDEELMISPLDQNCTKYFHYSGYGEIIPTEKPELEAAAKTTIQKLALNIDKLRKMRRAAIDGVLEVTEGLTPGEIEVLAKSYKKLDSQGKYTPFWATVTYTLEQFF